MGGIYIYIFCFPGVLGCVASKTGLKILSKNMHVLLMSTITDFGSRPNKIKPQTSIFFRRMSMIQTTEIQHLQYKKNIFNLP